MDDWWYNLTMVEYLVNNYKKLENNIVYFESVIPNYQELIDIAEKTETEALTGWNAWCAYGSTAEYGEIKYLSRKKLNDVKNKEEKNNSAFVIDSLINVMAECAKKYAEIYNIDKNHLDFAVDVLNNENTKIGIYKYFENADMGPHVDFNDENDYLAYTIVVYLNDNYEGGELYFNEFDIKVKPKAGSVMMYPSFKPYVHESLTVTKGRKMLITHHWRSFDHQ
jgi:hypothetical protein